MKGRPMDIELKIALHQVANGLRRTAEQLDCEDITVELVDAASETLLAGVKALNTIARLGKGQSIIFDE